MIDRTLENRQGAACLGSGPGFSGIALFGRVAGHEAQFRDLRIDRLGGFGFPEQGDQQPDVAAFPPWSFAEGAGISDM
jgi:hypothetical protein